LGNPFPQLQVPPLPGAPAGVGQIPTWTPPVAPAPSQAHPPLLVPQALQALPAGKLLTISPTLLVSEMWTDNFNFTTTNKQTDYRTVVGPGANVILNAPTTKGTFTGTWGFTYDTAASSSDNYNLFPNLALNLIQTFTPRLNLTLTDNYVRNNNPVQSNQFGLNTQRQTYTSNSLSVGLNYLLDTIATQIYYRNSYYKQGSSENGNNTTANIVGASASMPFGTFNSVRVGYEYSWADTSGTSSGINSGQVTGNLVTASFTRQTGQYSSAGIQGSYQEFTQPNSASQSNNFSSQSNNGNGHIWNVSLFSTYGLPSGLSFSGSLGYSQLVQSGQSNQSGVTSNSNLSYRFGPALASIGVFSDFQQTGLTGQNFGVVETHGVTGSLLYTFTPLLTSSLNAYYTFNSPTGSGNNSSSENTDNFNLSLNLNWQFLTWLGFYGQYSYSVWNNGGGFSSGVSSNSANSNGTIHVNSVLIGLRAAF